MSDKKKINLCKPPVPARPKNLVVLNSKHLPKPPETFLSQSVTNIIKDLNLNKKDEELERRIKVKNSGHTFENSDSEEDTYGYLEPMSLSGTNSTSANTIGKVGIQSQHKKHSFEENLKCRDIFQKVISRNSSGSLGKYLHFFKLQLSYSNNV